MKNVSVWLILLFLFTVSFGCTAEKDTVLIPDGWWEEGYYYYAEINDNTFILRDYARRPVLESIFTASLSEDGCTEIFPDEIGLCYEDSDYIYGLITSLYLKDGVLVMNEYSPLQDETTQYLLQPVDHGPFDHLILLDDIYLEELQGLWFSEAEPDMVLEFDQNRMYTYSNDAGMIDETDFRIVIDSASDSPEVLLVPESLIYTQPLAVYHPDDGSITVTLFTASDTDECFDIVFIQDSYYDVWEPYNDPDPYGEDIPVCYKPVIYLYPEEDTPVTVALELDGTLTCTYPILGDCWKVTARPDGTLTDESGTEYSYLYWEGRMDSTFDFSAGFCVPGSETASFLEDSLEQLGLTRREANEFIVFWLPQLQTNAYNLISFQSESYTDHARLSVDPKPDSVIRVFMACRPLQEPVDIPPQELPSTARNGFVLVEWGGSIADVPQDPAQ